MKNRDLEEELWKVYDDINAEGLEATDRKLKSLDLLVKMRVAGTKIKHGDDASPTTGRAEVERVLKKLNS